MDGFFCSELAEGIEVVIGREWAVGEREKREQ